MWTSRTLNRLEQMLDDAIEGDFLESSYDESKLSRLETKWKYFLDASVLSRQNVEKDREKIQEFVTDISHQTKIPMTNIKMYAELLMESLNRNGTKEEQEQQKMLASELIRQTERLDFLMEALTKISRLESEMMAVSVDDAPIEPMIANVIGRLQEKADGKGIKLHYLAEPSEHEHPVIHTKEDADNMIIPSVHTAKFDPKWTEEALANIVDNAIKYSPPDSDVSLRVLPYEMYTAVCVRDQGDGIPEEEQSRIFGRFYRGEAVRQKPGVGVGLYLAREIVEKEGGYIRVKSEMGRGSEFMMYLRR